MIAAISRYVIFIDYVGGGIAGMLWAYYPGLPIYSQLRPGLQNTGSTGCLPA